MSAHAKRKAIDAWEVSIMHEGNHINQWRGPNRSNA